MRAKWSIRSQFAAVVLGVALAFSAILLISSTRSATKSDGDRLGITWRESAPDEALAINQWLFPRGWMGMLLLSSAFALLTREIIVGARTRSELAGTVEVLRGKVEIMQSILSSMGDGVIIADQNGQFLNWNPAAEQLGALDSPFGLFTPRGGTSSADSTPGYPAYQAPLAQAVRGEQVTTKEMFVRNDQRPEGAWVDVSGRPLRNGRGQLCGGLVILRDRTQVRRAEQEISRLQEALERYLPASELAHKDRRAA